MSLGSDDERGSPADELLDQMREATERLRDKAWMVAPPSSPSAPEQPEAPDEPAAPDDT